jgi:hypothetical protein
MRYRYNINIQSLNTGFFKKGGIVIALAENGSYSRCYSRYRAYIALI